jgi:hypothetical protein
MDSNHQYLSRGQRRVIANSTLGAASRPSRSSSVRAILAVEVEKIEQEEDRRGGRAGIRWGLDHGERGDAAGRPAQFAVGTVLRSS